ncbi:uncharacterized protein LOC114325944 [Diabrotica virgifera virgifera]|uniref:THAP-type domain-containing protein n=1 Tax=Diabrotica virgifera virgifera TaxID=50390 RepID=A0ABM5ICL9_DIAVI|nr:uncharacterized protein LOC114325944 [Diabrotica virgifera virgifera]
MVRSCSAFGCTTRSSKTEYVFRFPMNFEEKKKDWENALGRKGFSATRNSGVCYKHFRPEDFKQNRTRVNLKYNAVPSIFKQSSKCLKTKENKPRRLLCVSRQIQKVKPVQSQNVPSNSTKENKPRTVLDKNASVSSTKQIPKVEPVQCQSVASISTKENKPIRVYRNASVSSTKQISKVEPVQSQGVPSNSTCSTAVENEERIVIDNDDDIDCNISIKETVQSQSVPSTTTKENKPRRVYKNASVLFTRQIPKVEPFQRQNVSNTSTCSTAMENREIMAVDNDDNVDCNITTEKTVQSQRVPSTTTKENKPRRRCKIVSVVSTRQIPKVEPVQRQNVPNTSTCSTAMESREIMAVDNDDDVDCNITTEKTVQSQRVPSTTTKENKPRRVCKIVSVVSTRQIPKVEPIQSQSMPSTSTCSTAVENEGRVVVDNDNNFVCDVTVKNTVQSQSVPSTTTYSTAMENREIMMVDKVDDVDSDVSIKKTVQSHNVPSNSTKGNKPRRVYKIASVLSTRQIPKVEPVQTPSVPSTTIKESKSIRVYRNTISNMRQIPKIESVQIQSVPSTSTCSTTVENEERMMIANDDIDSYVSIKDEFERLKKCEKDWRKLKIRYILNLGKLQKKIRTLNQKLRRKNKKLDKMKELIKSFKGKSLVDMELGQRLNNDLAGMNEDALEIFIEN